MRFEAMGSSGGRMSQSRRRPSAATQLNSSNNTRPVDVHQSSACVLKRWARRVVACHHSHAAPPQLKNNTHVHQSSSGITPHSSHHQHAAAMQRLPPLRHTRNLSTTSAQNRCRQHIDNLQLPAAAAHGECWQHVHAHSKCNQVALGCAHLGTQLMI